MESETLQLYQKLFLIVHVPLCFAMVTTWNTPLCHLQKFEGTVYTFGFGSDHDSNMLEAISTQGGGVYYYIDSNEKVEIVAS